MAFPDNELSSVPVPSEWLGAGIVPSISRMLDYEDGPIAEQDPTAGNSYQRWWAQIGSGEVVLHSEYGEPRVILSSPESSAFTDISIAFNQNADLHYAYVEEGVAKFYWYDTLISGFSTMILPTGTRTPKCTLDDKRPTQSGRSDIILSYVKADNGLYFRMQRDRFQIEYLLDAGPFISIERMYMNRGYRLQWLMTRGTV